jgi:hypothetical protein
MTDNPRPDSEERSTARIPVTLLQRRGIEAEVLVPFIRRLERELGPDRAHELARETIAEIAREQGAAVAQAMGRSDLDGFGEVRDSWGGAGGDLTIEPVRHDAEHLDFNVTRCRFVELYEQLGARDLGFVLSCGRDRTLSEGYSTDLHLVRTQTIMQGAAFCDFRYTYGTATDGGEAQSEPDAAPDMSPQRSHIRRGTGTGFGIGDDANKSAKDVFTDRVRQATEAARAAAERNGPGARQAAQDAAQQARERAQQAADAARPHVEHAAQEATAFAREHEGELKSAAMRAARIAARLVVPKNVRDAFEEELHREPEQPGATPTHPADSTQPEASADVPQDPKG